MLLRFLREVRARHLPGHQCLSWKFSRQVRVEASMPLRLCQMDGWHEGPAPLGDEVLYTPDTDIP
jgi:hypothetical protein